MFQHIFISVVEIGIDTQTPVRVMRIAKV